MKSAYLTSGIRFPNLWKLVFRHGISFLPKYLGRFLFIMQSSIWASIFSIKEKKNFKDKIESAELPDDPIIIVGHWRTGSTFLHQLFNLDPNVVTPNVFQGSVPDSMLTSRKSFEPVMGKMLKGTRPMDQVKLGMDEPLEDEYALFRLCTFSPLENLIFPKSGEYFLANDSTFSPDNKKHFDEWKNAVKLFYKKLMVHKKGVLLIKNPFHSMRMDALLEIFPKARFIHIVRNAENVVPSTVKMWNIVGQQNALNNKWKKPDLKSVSEVFKKVVDEVDNKLQELPAERYQILRFEDLEKNPFSKMENIYNYFNEDFSIEFQEKLKSFLDEIKTYKKNQYSLSDGDREIIHTELDDYMKKYDYH